MMYNSASNRLDDERDPLRNLRRDGFVSPFFAALALRAADRILPSAVPRRASPPATRSRTAPKKRAVNEKAPDAPRDAPGDAALRPRNAASRRRRPERERERRGADPAPIKYSIAPNSPNSSARIGSAPSPTPLHPLDPLRLHAVRQHARVPSRSRARARRRPRTPRSSPARRPPGRSRRSRRVRTSSRPGERRRIRAARGRAPSPRRSPAGAAPALRRARGRRRGNPATSSSARAGTRIGSVIGFGSVPPGNEKIRRVFSGGMKRIDGVPSPRILGKRLPPLERVLQELLPEPFDVLERFSCASQRRVEPSQDVVPPRDVRERLRESRARPRTGRRGARPSPRANPPSSPSLLRAPRRAAASGPRAPRARRRPPRRPRASPRG